MTDDLIITLEDMAQVRGFSTNAGFCRGGGREWCKRHYPDWKSAWHRFRHEGVPATELLAVGDAFAIALVEQARARRALEASRGKP